MNKFLGRRSFLKSTGSAAALLGLAAVSSAKAEEKDIHWDQTVNYLIIGTGFAGLAAALESHYLGMKDVLVIDKMPSPGGNSIINGGAISAAGTDMQQKAGIKDSPDLLFADIMKAGGGLAHASLGRRIADESVANYEWLRDQIGVKFKAVTYHGGHSVPRSHAVQENSGAGFINPMLAKCKEFGIPIQLRTIVDELIVSPSGCLLGVKARKNYRMGRENSGKVAYIRSLKGVLIASGGFSQNVKMRSSHDPRLTAAFTSTNHPGATGEMIQHAQKIGANTIHMDWIQLGPWTSPDENGFGIAPLAVESMVGYGPMIDPATGKRFIKETGNRKVRADAIVALGHPALIYTTEENFMNKVVGKNMKQEQFETALAEGNIVEHTCYCENYYGTLRSEVERHMEQQIPVILVIEVEGAGNIKRMYPGSTTVFVMPPDMKELERRLRYRGTEAEEVIQKRLRRAETEIARSADYDEHVVNDVVDTCAEEIYSIIQKRIAEPDAE